MMIFLFILTIGFIYEWKKGALDWEYNFKYEFRTIKKKKYQMNLKNLLKGF